MEEFERKWGWAMAKPPTFLKDQLNEAWPKLTDEERVRLTEVFLKERGMPLRLDIYERFFKKHGDPPRQLPGCEDGNRWYNLWRECHEVAAWRKMSLAVIRRAAANIRSREDRRRRGAVWSHR